MTTEDAPKLFQEFLDSYQRGIWKVGEAEPRIYEFAAFIEPERLVAAVPESLRTELMKIASRPLLRREDYSTIEGVAVRPQNLASYVRDKSEREDRQYSGLSRLHQYLTQPKR